MKEDNSQLTSGQARRLAKKQAAMHANRAAKRNKTIGIISAAVVLAAFVAMVAVSIGIRIHDNIEEARLQASLIQVVEDYSAGLDDDGFIEGVDANDYISLDMDKVENIEIEYSNIAYSDEEVESDIETLLSDNSTDEITYEEFNDSFVKDVLGSDLTADEYREQIKKDKEKENTLTEIDNYLINLVEVKDLPEDYVITMAGNVKYMNLTGLQYINAMYESMGYSDQGYESVYDYMDMDMEEYEDYVIEKAKESVLSLLVYELVYKHFGLTVTDAEYEEYLAENDIDDESYYGKPYILRTLIYNKCVEYLYENAVTYAYAVTDSAE